MSSSHSGTNRPSANKKSLWGIWCFSSVPFPPKLAELFRAISCKRNVYRFLEEAKKIDLWYPGALGAVVMARPQPYGGRAEEGQRAAFCLMSLGGCDVKVKTDWAIMPVPPTLSSPLPLSRRAGAPLSNLDFLLCWLFLATVFHRHPC